jgi:predicted RNase H-like HicB family nuclease
LIIYVFLSDVDLSFEGRHLHVRLRNFLGGTMARYLVYIETRGDPITLKAPVAHVPALPGASARGQTIEEAKENIRLAIEQYLSLLRNVGEPVPKADEPILLEFEETEETTFVTDYDPMLPNELETLFRWMAISRQELMDMLRCMPQEMWDWRPSEDAWSVAQIICHLAESDLWYTDRLKQWPEAPLYRLAATRGIALERLRAVPETERGKVVHHQGEDWTMRKVIRRMLEHEREHIAQVRAMIEEYHRRTHTAANVLA